MSHCYMLLNTRLHAAELTVSSSLIFNRNVQVSQQHFTFFILFTPLHVLRAALCVADTWCAVVSLTVLAYKLTS